MAAPVKINIDTIANIIMKAAKIEGGDLRAQITKHMQEIGAVPIEVSPNIKIADPRKDPNLSRNLREMSRKLQGFVADGSEEAFRAAFSDLKPGQRGALKRAGFSQEIAKSFQGVFDDAAQLVGTEKLGGKITAQVKPKVAKIINDIFAGNNESFKKAKDTTKTQVREYITDLEAQAKQLNQLASRASSLGGGITTQPLPGGKGAGEPFRSPITKLLLGIEEQARTASERVRLLKANTNTTKIAANAVVEQRKEDARLAKEQQALDRARRKRAVVRQGREVLGSASGNIDRIFSATGKRDLSAVLAAVRARQTQLERIKLAVVGTRRQGLIKVLDEQAAIAQDQQLSLRKYLSATQQQHFDRQAAKAAAETKRVNAALDKKIQAEARTKKKMEELLTLRRAVNRGRAALSASDNSVQQLFDTQGQAPLRDAQVLLQRRSQILQRRINASTTSTADRLAAQKALVTNEAELTRARRLINRVTKSTENLSRETIRSGSVIRQFFRYALGYGALYQAVSAVRALVGGLVSLDEELHNIKAIASATDGEMRNIESTIKRVAVTTKFSVTEVAKAAQILAQAGVSPDQFGTALESVAKFASATSSSIAVAADLVSTMRNVFTDLNDPSIANLLTKAINVSKLTAEDLKVVASIGAQIGKSYNLSGEQFLAAAATLRNAGLKASTVATGFRQGLVEIFSPDKKTVDLLVSRYKTLGQNLSREDVVSRFFSFTGQKNPLVSALRELERLGFTGSGKKLFARTFNVRATNAISALIANIKELEATSSKLTFGASAAKASETQMQSLANSWKNLGAVITSFTADISGGAIAALQNLVEKAAESVTSIANINDAIAAKSGNASLSSGLSGSLIGGSAAFALSSGSFTSRILKSLIGAVVGGGVASGATIGAERAGAPNAILNNAGVIATIGTLIGYVVPRVLALLQTGNGKEIRSLVGSLFGRSGGKLASATTSLGATAAAAAAPGAVSKTLSFIGSKFSAIRGKFGKAFSPISKFTGTLGNIAKVISRGIFFTAPGRVIAGILALAGVFNAVFSRSSDVEEILKRQKETLKQQAASSGELKSTKAAISEFDLSVAAPGTGAGQVKALQTGFQDYRAQLSDVLQGDTAKIDALRGVLSLAAAGSADAHSPGFEALRKKASDIAGKDIPSSLFSLLLAQESSIAEQLKGATRDAGRSLLDVTGRTPKDPAGKALSVASRNLPQETFNRLIGTIASTDEQKLKDLITLFNAVKDAGLNSQGTRAKQAAAAQDTNAAASTFIDGFKTRFTGPENDVLRKFQAEAADLPTEVLSEAARLMKKAFKDGLSGVPKENLTVLSRDVVASELDRRAAVLASDNKRVTEGVSTKVENARSIFGSPGVQKQIAHLPDSQQGSFNDLFAGKTSLTIPGEGGKIQANPVVLILLKRLDNIQAQIEKSLKVPVDRVTPASVLGEIKAAGLEVKRVKKENPLSLENTDLATNPIAKLFNLQIQEAGRALGAAQDQLTASQGLLTEEERTKFRKRVEKYGTKVEELGLQLQVELKTAADNAKLLRLANEKRLATIDLATATRERAAATSRGDTDAAKVAADKERELRGRIISLTEQELEAKHTQKDILDATAKDEKRKADAARLGAESAAAQAGLENLQRTGPIADPALAGKVAAGGTGVLNRERIAFLKEQIRLNEKLAETNKQSAENARITDPNKVVGFEQRARDADIAVSSLRFQVDRLQSSISDALGEGFSSRNFISGLEQSQQSVTNLAASINTTLVDGANSAGDVVAQTFAEMFDKTLRDGKGFASQMKSVLRSIGTGIAGGIARAGTNILINSIVGTFTGGSTTSTPIVGTPTPQAHGTSSPTMFSATGGIIRGAGTGTSDSVSGVLVNSFGAPTAGIRVSTGESILNAAATRLIGESGIHNINRNAILRAATGGVFHPSTGSRTGNIVASTHEFSAKVSIEGKDLSASQLANLDRVVQRKILATVQEESRPGGILTQGR